LSYNNKYSNNWDFSGLDNFFENLAIVDEQEFFAKILPAIISLALKLPEYFPEGSSIPLLVPLKQQTIKLTQREISCLLANAFLCTFPHRNNSKGKFSKYPTINFSALYAGTNGNCLPQQAAKIRCILHYFNRVTSQEQDGFVTFHRRALNKFPNWAECSETLSQVTVHSEGSIEDSPGMLQVDFANRMIGGGVLSKGCVQEEIRFAICTELIIARLFCAQMEENECIIITGAERYSNYSGYSHRFRCTGPHYDPIEKDEHGRRKTKIVAMDAQFFQHENNQFNEKFVVRELNKAYCAFMSSTSASALPLATGNWGCGAFNGDVQLKFLLQLMAASAAKQRPLHYFTFNNGGLARELEFTYSELFSYEITVGQLYLAILEFCREKKQDNEYPKIFDFVKFQLAVGLSLK